MPVQPLEQRIARLNKYIEKVEEAQSSMFAGIREGKFEAFSENDIKFHLSHDPDSITETALYVAEFRRNYEYAKLDTKLITAEIWKEANLNKEALGLTNAKDRDAYVTTQPRYQEAVRQEIEWKYRLEQMEAIASRYENLYIGTRKLAAMFVQDKSNYDQGV